MTQFDFTMTDSTTYAGKDTEGFFRTALLSAPSVKNVTIVSNCKSSLKLSKFDLGNILQADGTTFSATGEGTLSQITVTSCPIRINLTYPKSQFEQNYLNEFLQAGSNNAEVAPKSFIDYVVDSTAVKAGADFEKMFWGGSTTASGSTYPYSLCDGIEYKLSADSTVVDVTALFPSGITSSSIIAEITRVYDAIPNTIITRGQVKIYMSTVLVKLFKQAVAAASAELYYTKDAPLNFLGIEIVEAPGMGAYRMVAGEPENIKWVTDLISDQDQLKILNMEDHNGDRTIRCFTSMKFGTAVLTGAEVVFYWR